jgi:tetratricopeptide (TPR) repeat protein
MSGIEPYIPEFSTFLFGLSYKCIFEAVKKWKEGKDQDKLEKDQLALQNHEFAKSISLKVQQRITASIQHLRLSQDQFQQVLALETNPLLKDELANQFLASSITAKSIYELFVKHDPALESLHDQLLALANAWLEEMEKAVAEDAVLSTILNFRAHRATLSGLDSIGNLLAKSEVRDHLSEQLSQQRHQEQMAALAALTAGLNLRSSSDGASSIPDHLQDQNQRRFERARKEFLEGSVEAAEREFAGLVEDLEALGTKVNLELLLRSYLNLASALWELNKHSEASSCFEKAFNVLPTDWRAKRAQAFMLIDHGDYDEALVIFRAVRLARPKEAEHVCNEAWVLKSSGKVQNAIELLESNVFEDHKYFAMLSFAYLEADRYPDAEKAARRALQLDAQSEVALTSLSFALAFPIIQRRMKRETMQFVPSGDERAKLLEAISYAEQAAKSLRHHKRFYSLREVLANLTAFYAGVGDCQKAISLADESLQYYPDDLINLTNLCCIQMRLHRFDDAAITAAKLERLGDPVQGWHKRAEALVLAEKSQEVLDSWEGKKIDKRFSENAEVVAVVARAFAKRHRTTEGLNLLGEALNRDPSNAVLLSERAFLLETLDRIDEARTDLVAAEQVATADCRAQILVDTAMFFYRRRDWREASTRLQQLDAESIYNPLFATYLTCLFNQGEYRRSLVLAEMAIKQAKAFVEDTYAIAARCHHICDNLYRAKELLEDLVARGTVRELEHRKLLAWVYWRMDELSQAHDVLIRTLKLKADDLDSLILMSAVCSALGKNDEAMSYGMQAITASPNAGRSHTALVSAAFACPSDSKPTDSQRDAVYRSLAFLHEHEPGILRAVPMEPDLHSILEIVKTRSHEVRKFEHYFQSHNLPMGLFGNRFGNSIFEIWRGLSSHPRLRVRIAFGTTEEQKDELAVALAADAVSVDLFALLTLQHLNLLHLLPLLYRRIYAHPSLLDAVVTDIRELQRHPTQGSIAFVAGTLLRRERTLQETEFAQNFLAQIRDFLKSPVVTLIGLLPETLRTGHSESLLKNCGMASIAPLLVAKEQGVACFSDDAVVRAIGRLDDRIPGFSTQTFIRVAAERGVIKRNEYQDAVLKLIESNYTFISEDAGTLARVYERSGGCLNPLAMSLINRVNSTQYNSKSCLPVLAAFVAHIWMNKAPDGANPREQWVGEVWLAISKANNAKLLALEFVAHMAVTCSMQPAIFSGIMIFTILHVGCVNRHRLALFLMMQEAIKTMSSLTREMNPLMPDLSKDWKSHGRLNQILERQGFLRLYDQVAENVTRKPKQKSGGHKRRKRGRRHG